MKVTYIGHSGFLIEWERCYWLFDYYTGSIPRMDESKKLLVFASHSHGDHFNPKIFDLQDGNPAIEYVLSSDIEPAKVSTSALGSALFVDAEKLYELHDGHGNVIGLRTLKSTDLGVAFLLSYLGKTIYHAGDLNLWVWKEEPEQYNQDMTAMFNQQMSSLKGLAIDVAFAPLDPRQEEDYYLGLESLLGTASIKYVFPMHFGSEFSIIDKYKKERANAPGTQIMDVRQAGQAWEIDF
jgi:L-ascorbate metabolism protein UlaG (beta-lactamase superfamily)